MKAYAVIGSNYGDEGKGIITDYLSWRNSAAVVIRFCGGAQAGHTVTLPGYNGHRHVFHHFGSGTLQGIRTYLSKFFLVNPIQFTKELETLPFLPKVYIDADALVTTPWDMLINQAFERKRGRTASCGIGINETMQRSKHEQFKFTVSDLLSWDEEKLDRIQYEYVPYRLTALGLDIILEKHWRDVFETHATIMLNKTLVVFQELYNPLNQIAAYGGPLVFEGAQGLMLDQDSPDFPYVTHAHTGSKNVKELCAEWGVTDLELTYVTRSYLTRHGAGPLPNEEPLPDWVVDHTNINHEFQGVLRYAPLDTQALKERIVKDAGDCEYNVAVTHMDQKSIVVDSLPVKYTSYGPTRDHVMEI